MRYILTNRLCHGDYLTGCLEFHTTVLPEASSPQNESDKG